MSEQYDIIPYHPLLKEGLLDLQKGLWGPDPENNRAYFEWKYEQNPRIPDPLIYAARHGDTLVAMRGACPIVWQAGQPPFTFLMPYPDDFVIVPAHRNRRLVTRIMESLFADLALRGYEYVFSMTTGHVTMLSQLAMGWKAVGPAAPVGAHGSHVRRFRTVRNFASRQRFIWRYAHMPFLFPRCQSEPFCHLDRPRVRTLTGFNRRVSVSQSPRPAEMARLIARMPYDGRIRHLRDEAYFAWAFRNPKHAYRFLYWDEDHLEGYLVLQTYLPSTVDNNRVHIMDWEATTERARGGLLATAMKRGMFPELACRTLNLSPSTLRLLDVAGFAPVDLDNRKRGLPSLLVRPVSSEKLAAPWNIGGRSILAPENWDVRWIY